jgi:two-component system response regulator ChvI
MPVRRVALVEDEQTIREAVGLALRREGFDVAEFDDGLAAWETLEVGLPDLAVLDIGLPRMDGLELCRRLRSRSELVPIIFVTSREEEFDRVLGLEIGADDYLCKPFSMRELVARVRVLLRRSAARAAIDARPDDRPITVGGLRLDAPTLRATWNGEPVALTVTEFLLLQALASRPDHVKSREQLMDAAYPDGTSVSDRTIDSHIKRIRRKIELVDRAFANIEGIYGAGYRYRSEG